MATKKAKAKKVAKIPVPILETIAHVLVRLERKFDALDARMDRIERARVKCYVLKEVPDRELQDYQGQGTTLRL